MDALAALPAPMLANVGTPLMWAEGLHLMFGNAIIGLIEAGLLTLLFKVPWARAALWMILANYFSAWVGWMWLLPQVVDSKQFSLYDFWTPLCAVIAVAYLITLVIEWPFVALCFPGMERRWRQTIWGTLIVQTASYSLLLLWYGVPSGTSLFTEMTIVPLQEIALPPGTAVYYIDDADGNVYRRDLGTLHPERVFDLRSSDEKDVLGVQPHGAEYALVTSRGQDLGTVLTADALTRNEAGGIETLEIPAGLWRYGIGPAARLGEARHSPWSFEAGHWPIAGLHGENTKTGAQIWFSLETPFVAWLVRSATILPNDCVLFQLGPRQICVLEPATKKVALLARGRGPVAVLTAVAAPLDAVEPVGAEVERNDDEQCRASSRDALPPLTPTLPPRGGEGE